MGKDYKQKYYNRVIIIHQNKYIYFDDYINKNNKIKIECPKHGLFYKYPHHHLNGDGCNECKKIELYEKNKNKFINNANEVHNYNYNYDKSIYTGYKENLIVTCPKHGDFEIKPLNHIHGSGCKQCSIDKQTKKHSDFLIQANKVHSNFYTYPEEYKSSSIKMKILCPKHGEFYQLPKNHVFNKQGCPHCKRSNGELKIEELLNNKNIQYTSEYKFKDCKYKSQLPFDFYLTDFNICIEYDGEQHFHENKLWGGLKSLELQVIKDNIKTEYCKNNNIDLLRIRYDENIENKLNIFLKEKGII